MFFAWERAYRKKCLKKEWDKNIEDLKKCKQSSEDFRPQNTNKKSDIIFDLVILAFRRIFLLRLLGDIITAGLSLLVCLAVMYYNQNIEGGLIAYMLCGLGNSIWRLLRDDLIMENISPIEFEFNFKYFTIMTNLAGLVCSLVFEQTTDFDFAIKVFFIIYILVVFLPVIGQEVDSLCSLSCEKEKQTNLKKSKLQ